MDDETSYVRVTFDDSTTFDLPLHEWDNLVERLRDRSLLLQNYFHVTRDVLGGRVGFFLSKVQDVFESTPEVRAEQDRINKLLEMERQDRGGWED